MARVLPAASRYVLGHWGGNWDAVLGYWDTLLGHWGAYWDSGGVQRHSAGAPGRYWDTVRGYWDIVLGHWGGTGGTGGVQGYSAGTLRGILGTGEGTGTLWRYPGQRAREGDSDTGRGWHQGRGSGIAGDGARMGGSSTAGSPSPSMAPLCPQVPAAAGTRPRPGRRSQTLHYFFYLIVF